jgi:RNA polymerase sigma-70 factor (ECF subfamily)
MEPGHERTDEELMATVRAGNRTAFAEIYARHAPRVYAYLWRMLQDEALAEDLRQEAFIRLWQQRTKWSSRGSVAGYLVRVARNEALNAIEKGRVQRRWAVDQAGGPQATAPAPDTVLEQRHTVECVSAAIEALPDRAREVFSLKRDAGLSYREIGELLGISPKTVEAHMSKAYALLRSALSDSSD